MDKSQIWLILQGIDQQIVELNRKLRELQTAKEAFIREHKDNLSGSESLDLGFSSPNYISEGGRLVQGTPRKWIMEAMEKAGRTSASQLNEIIKKLHGRKLASGTLWRVLKDLKDNDEAINHTDNSTWELILRD